MFILSDLLNPGPWPSYLIISTFRTGQLTFNYGMRISVNLTGLPSKDDTSFLINMCIATHIYFFYIICKLWEGTLDWSKLEIVQYTLFVLSCSTKLTWLCTVSTFVSCLSKCDGVTGRISKVCMPTAPFKIRLIQNVSHTF